MIEDNTVMMMMMMGIESEMFVLVKLYPPPY